MAVTESKVCVDMSLERYGNYVRNPEREPLPNPDER